MLNIVLLEESRETLVGGKQAVLGAAAHPQQVQFAIRLLGVGDHIREGLI